MRNFGLVLFAILWTYSTVLSHYVQDEIQARVKDPWLKRYMILFTFTPLLLFCFLVPREDKIMRGLLAQSSAFYFLKASEVFLQARFKKEELKYRMMHIGMSFHDIQTRKPLYNVDKQLRKTFMGMATAGGTLALALGLLSGRKVVPNRQVQYMLGAFSGALYIKSSLELFGHSLQLAFTPMRIKLPELMDQVTLSTSLREFWGKRWDTAMQSVLKTNVNDPLIELGYDRSVAALATFFASGFMHVYPLFMVGLSVRNAAFMFMYFIVEAFLTLFEVLFIPKDLPTTTKRVWTLSAAIAPCFLFAEPMYALGGITL